jgi:LacI family transcriptional regulator
MQLLLSRTPRPDGVFAYNDPLAIGAMLAILDAGLRIPEDIAVIGSGNLHYDSSLRVPLSSVDQHSLMIGERTASILLRLIESKVRPQAMSIVLDPSLVVRASSTKKRTQSTESSSSGKRAQSKKQTSRTMKASGH